MCACCPSGVVDKEAELPREACTYVLESCSICRHHVLKDFCTPVIKEVHRHRKQNLVGGLNYFTVLPLVY